MENKITVISKGDEVLIGGAFHVLNDASVDRFDTNHIKEFFNFVTRGKPPCTDIVIFYNNDNLSAFKYGVELRGIEPFAQCALEKSTQLKTLIDINVRNIGPDKMEIFVDALKKYYDANAKRLVDILRDQSIKKILDIKRKKDNSGNFLFSFQIQNDGLKDIEYPEKISFEVPLYKYHTETIKVSFDVVFSYDINKKDNQVAIDLIYQLRNYSLDEEIAERQEEIIKNYIEESPCLAWRGGYRVIKKDDSWKYLPNNKII